MVVMDFNNVGITQLPVKQLKGFVLALQRKFRARMFRTVIVRSHWLLRGLWNIVWGWLDEFVQQKIIILGYKDIEKTLTDYIQVEDLEEKFGGKKPNIVANYFPPQLV
mmetsp:Transcript_39651/g.60727  ORF Transcript_39651/g.60727 Transcript_39651/m.60727 type:complete len:108 (-) Transcript_39651:12-335(-)